MRLSFLTSIQKLVVLNKINFKHVCVWVFNEWPYPSTIHLLTEWTHTVLIHNTSLSENHVCWILPAGSSSKFRLYVDSCCRSEGLPLNSEIQSAPRFFPPEFVCVHYVCAYIYICLVWEYIFTADCDHLIWHSISIMVAVCGNTKKESLTVEYVGV